MKDNNTEFNIAVSDILRKYIGIKSEIDINSCKIEMFPQSMKVELKLSSYYTLKDRTSVDFLRKEIGIKSEVDINSCKIDMFPSGMTLELKLTVFCGVKGKESVE